jgi:hypothetical protein
MSFPRAKIQRFNEIKGENRFFNHPKIRYHFKDNFSLHPLACKVQCFHTRKNQNGGHGQGRDVREEVRKPLQIGHGFSPQHTMFSNSELKNHDRRRYFVFVSL